MTSTQKAASKIPQRRGEVLVEEVIALLDFGCNALEGAAGQNHSWLEMSQLEVRISPVQHVESLENRAIEYSTL